MSDPTQKKIKSAPNQKSTSLKIKLDDLLIFDPLTANQKIFYDAYKKGVECIVLTGSAGSGKSMIAIYKAIEEVLDKSNPYDKVVMIRSAVQVRDQGYVSGDLEEKSAIYEAPYVGIASKLFNRPDAWQRLKEQRHAEFVTTTAIRGITFDDCIIIVDEMQCMNYHELYTIATRVGDNSKIIFIGDRIQNDLIKNRNDQSGFTAFIDIIKRMPNKKIIEFGIDDIVRSGFVKEFIIASESNA